MNKAELNGVSPWFVECFEIVQLSFTSSATHSNFLSAARSHEADFLLYDKHIKNYACTYISTYTDMICHELVSVSRETFR